MLILHQIHHVLKSAVAFAILTIESSPKTKLTSKSFHDDSHLRPIEFRLFDIAHELEKLFHQQPQFFPCLANSLEQFLKNTKKIATSV